jgi:RNA polymerase sigma-70 factor
LLRHCTGTVEEIWQRVSAPAEWGVTISDFAAALERSAAHHFSGRNPDPGAVRAYLSGLHFRDLVLACACRVGNAAAWDYFVAEFRPELYRAARAIAGDAPGRDLADSIYAELYGLRTGEGCRRSPFESFYGRSKLSTWLHAILAQRHVDEWRRSRKLESLDEERTEEGAAREYPAVVSSAQAADPERDHLLAILQAAVAEALKSLEPLERLRLAYYYADGLTLAQIGRLLGEHEATVSRKLDRIRSELHRRVDSALRERKRLSEAQVQLCYQYANEEWPFDLTRALRD